MLALTHRHLASLTCALSCATLGATTALAAEEPAVTCSERVVQVGSALVPRQIAGTYCRPAGTTPATALVMVPGATYNRVYWDFPYRPETYSFARAAARRGYGAFAVDRLGTGASSKPLSVAVTGPVQAHAVHEVIDQLRDEGLDQVLLAGHSLGSAVSIIEAGSYRDVDGVILTGAAHTLSAPGLLAGMTSMYPAALDPAFASAPPDLGYLTTRPGTRQQLLHDPGIVEPRVIAVDEQTKDAVSGVEFAEAGTQELVLGYGRHIDAPTLLAIGSGDPLFCGPLGADCSTAAAFLAQERPSFPDAPCVDAFVVPGAGHDVNLHPSAPALQEHVLDWADAVTAGSCPDGS